MKMKISKGNGKEALIACLTVMAIS